MESLSAILLIAAAVVGVILLIKLLSAPIRKILKLLINAALGFVLLFVVNFFGAAIGLELKLNLINALVAGFLGIPGIILLVILQFLF